MQNRDTVGEAQSLDLIMSDVDQGLAERFVQAPKLDPKFQPHPGIQIRQGSSSNNISEGCAMARPIATRWRSPPE